MNKFKIALFFSVVLLAAVAFFLFRESAKDASDGSYDDSSLVGADAGACSLFDDHIMAVGGHFLHAVGGQADPVFVDFDFLGNPD